MHPSRPYSFERREPRDRDVAIDIHYCGVCHSDIHQARDEWGGSIFPMVPGHEIVGVVRSVGAKVSKFKVGETVALACSSIRATSARNASAGWSSTAPRARSRRTTGASTTERRRWAAIPTKIVVHEDFVLRMPANLPPAAAAPLLCAGVTLYSPLMH